MDSKFGSLWGVWCSIEHLSHLDSGTFGMGLWKNIRRGWRIF